MLAAVKSSAGISVLPTYLATDALLRGEVVKLLEPEIPPINTFYLAIRDGGMCHPDLPLLHDHLLAGARLCVTAVRPGAPWTGGVRRSVDLASVSGTA